MDTYAMSESYNVDSFMLTDKSFPKTPKKEDAIQEYELSEIEDNQFSCTLLHSGGSLA